jgi:hypothetical protein
MGYDFFSSQFSFSNDHAACFSRDVFSMPNVLPILYGGQFRRSPPTHRRNDSTLAATGQAAASVCDFVAADVSFFAPALALAPPGGEPSIAESPLTSSLSSLGGARGSAIAAAMSAAVALRSGHEIVALFTADFAIHCQTGFMDACKRATETAQAGSIVCLGVAADEATRGAGYIRPGPRIGEGLFKAARFTHAHDLAAASVCAQRKDILNMGTFFFRADVMLGEMELRAPGIAVAAGLAAERANYVWENIRTPDETTIADRSLDEILAASRRVVVATASAAKLLVGGLAPASAQMRCA